jgi:hypothetical protein
VTLAFISQAPCQLLKSVRNQAVMKLSFLVEMNQPRNLSCAGDRLRGCFAKWLICKGLFLSLVGDSGAVATELAGVEVVFLQQAVELRTVAFGKPGRIGDIAVG